MPQITDIITDGDGRVVSFRFVPGDFVGTAEVNYDLNQEANADGVPDVTSNKLLFNSVGFEEGTIEGYVFVDSDGNGAVSNGNGVVSPERRLAGITVQLFGVTIEDAPGTQPHLIAEVQTDAYGYYKFDPDVHEILPGTYTVQ